MNAHLGNTYTDRITGFKGVCTGFVEYISGCNQLLLVPKTTKEGNYQEGQWFDEQRMESVKAKPVRLDNGRTPGCDIAAPKR